MAQQRGGGGGNEQYQGGTVRTKYGVKVKAKSTGQPPVASTCCRAGVSSDWALRAAEPAKLFPSTGCDMHGVRA